MLKKMSIVFYITLFIFSSAYIFPQSRGNAVKNVKTAPRPQSRNFNPYPTPYNSAQQDLKIDISIDEKINSAAFVLYTSDKKEIERLSLGALEKGNYSRTFDRGEFKGIANGTYYFRIIDLSSGNGDGRDYKPFYILR